jgi:hypothetical protein
MSSLKAQIAKKYPALVMKADAVVASTVKWYQKPMTKKILFALLFGFLFMIISCPHTYSFVGELVQKLPGMGSLVYPVQLKASLSCKLVIIHSIVFAILASIVLSFHKCC